MTVRIGTSGWVHPHQRVIFDRFAQFLGVLPCGYQHMVKFRDASWLNEKQGDLEG